MFCSNCGQQIPDNAQFCSNCGTRTAASAVNVSSGPTVVDTVENSGILLASFKHISKYRGTPSATYARSVGVLSVFDNRLEFTRMVADELLSMNILGAARAASNSVAAIPLEEISGLSEGKYMGLYKTLVVTKKDGDVWSFCPAKPGGSMAREIIGLLNPYMPN